MSVKLCKGDSIVMLPELRVDAMKHLRYARYVLRHKWYVFVECCKLGIPFAGIVHDLSKLCPKEWGPYAQYFYGVPGARVHSDAEQLAFDVAWLRHQHKNPHHYQHWILLNDSGLRIVLDMPDRYRREMLADWKGAGRALGFSDTRGWYEKNKDNIVLSGATRVWVERQLGVAS